MPFLDNQREYRYFLPLTPSLKAKSESKGFIVEGYASTFDPYVLFEIDGVEYKEQIMPGAFDGADLSDVIMLYNHQGPPVFARNKNGTLALSVDEHGLKIRADLSKSTKAKELYEEIANGLVDQMSFAFTVAEEHFDPATNTRYIDKFKKLFDISVVDRPANPETEIGVATRSAYDGLIEKHKQELLEEEQRKAKQHELNIKLKLMKI